jgi:hypothetical protein
MEFRNSQEKAKEAEQAQLNAQLELALESPIRQIQLFHFGYPRSEAFIWWSTRCSRSVCSRQFGGNPGILNSVDELPPCALAAEAQCSPTKLVALTGYADALLPNTG